jgi:hypothetical protein
MERATVYRAISGCTAAIGGILALALGGFLLFQQGEWIPSPSAFIGLWTLVLCVVGALNIYSLHRGAKQRAEPFVSAGMKHALRAIVPALFAGFVLGLFHAWVGLPTPGSAYAEIAAGWTLCYGLALLATGAFSPRSMQVLGAAFFLLGLGLHQPAMLASGADDYALAVRIMMGCFGVLHLAYGAWVLAVSRKHARAAASVS